MYFYNLYYLCITHSLLSFNFFSHQVLIYLNFHNDSGRLTNTSREQNLDKLLSTIYRRPNVRKFLFIFLYASTIMYCMPMYLYYQHCNSAYFEAYLSCIIVVHLYISIFCFIYSPYVPHSVISRKPQTLYYFENSPHKPGGKSSFPFPRILSRLLFTTSAKTRFFSPHREVW